MNEREITITLNDETTKKLEDFFKIYETQHVINTDVTRKVFLGDRVNKRCRFCGKSSPEVEFKKKAHVIPQSIGNRNILSHFECDECNHFFGTTYDDSFASFFSDSRALASIKNLNSGKRAKHTELKTGFEIRHEGTSIQIYSKENSPEVVLDPKKKELTLLVTLPPHIPLFVFKAMMKIAMCMIDDGEIEAFESCFKLLKDTSKDSLFKDSTMFNMVVTSVPGPNIWTTPTAQLFTAKDKTADRNHPEKVFILYFFNKMYQIMIPQNANDKILVKKQVQIPILPPLIGINYLNALGHPFTYQMNMSSNEFVIDSKVKRGLTFEEMTSNDGTSA